MTKMFLTIDSYATETLEAIIARAEDIKKNQQTFMQSLQGKGLGIIFEKPSTRTRVSFEVGIHQLGGHSYYLAPHEIQLGQREEIRDIARTVSRYLDAVVLRTFSHATITEFAEYATIPIINGLSDFSHPCQAMADYLTIKEKFDDPKKVTVAYIGDGNNVLHSLLIILTRLGVNMTIATPQTYAPTQSVVDKAMAHAKEAGSTLTIYADPREAVKNADVVYTDVFVSMGEEEAKREKIQAFAGFQINAELLAASDKKPLIMHCLPARAIIASSVSVAYESIVKNIFVMIAPQIVNVTMRLLIRILFAIPSLRE